MDKYLKPFKACPMCGKTDRLYLTPRNHYYKLLAENGKACIGVTCHECSLSLYDFNDEIKGYSKKIVALALKWNSLPRNK